MIFLLVITDTEVTIAVVVPCGVCKTFSPCINIVFSFFLYSGPSDVMGSDRKQNTALAGARGVIIVALSISFH